MWQRRITPKITIRFLKCVYLPGRLQNRSISTWLT